MSLSDKAITWREFADEVSRDELWNHASRIASEERVTASPGEAAAVEYFKEFMTGLGLKVRILEIENYISLPKSAALGVISPEIRELNCITQSFSPSTPPEGTTGELVYVTPGLEVDVAGKIVMRDGLASPEPTMVMEQAGAIGQIWVSSGDLPRNMCISPIWGHPTPDNVYLLPANPVITVNKQTGDYLKQLASDGTTTVRLDADVWTGFAKVPLALADIKGKVEPEKYVLFNGHIDSWAYGAMDNGTANACMLELARLIVEHRDQLRRGVRFAWWSGHSQGRYSGSTWYVDHNWEDLHNNAIAHFNVDSLGATGATNYSVIECTAEMFDLGRDAVKTQTGQEGEYHRIGKSGDNSFWGAGLPTLFQLLSRQPKSGSGPDALIPGLPWFWHTEADTIDKIDPDILWTDAKIYASALWRLCTDTVLPINFVNVGHEIVDHLKQIQAKAGDAFDLDLVIERAKDFEARAAKLNRAAREVAVGRQAAKDRAGAQNWDEKAISIDDCLMKLSRILMPATYSRVDPYDLDLAVSIKPLPRLQPAADLACIDRESAEFKFAERKMIRERTRLAHALARADKLIESTLATVAA